MNKKTKRVGTFVWVGVVLTVIDYLLYELLVILFFKDMTNTSIASAIASTLSTIIAFFMHSKITWKDCSMTKLNIVKFFVWNLLMFVLLRPILIWMFGLLESFYAIVFNLLLWSGISYSFVISTGTYVLATVITMMLNFLFYDYFVFGNKKIKNGKGYQVSQKQDNQPLISIIVPIYNTEKYLKKCINSILKQTYKNLEIILVDDGSSDKSADIIDEYQKNDDRIITIHQKNGGQSNARNTGIKLARGKYLNFIDSDDEIAPNFIEELLNTVGDNNVLAATGMHFNKLYNKTENDAYISHVRCQKKNETLEAYVTFLLTIDGRMYGVINKLFLASVIKEYNLQFQEDLDFAEDTKFVLNYIKSAKPEIRFVEKPLYIYNFGTTTSTVKGSSTKWENWEKSYNDLKEFVGQNPNAQEKFWLKLVLLRWKISHRRSIRRAKK